jgi:translation initiation factor IF-1
MAKKSKTYQPKEEHVETTGIVTQALPGCKFKVLLDDINKEIISTISGKLRINKIMISEGDNVEVKISPYDVTQGIITWRK